MRERLGGDDRAVSTTVSYVLTLSITALLVSGLLLAAGGLVDDQRERATRTELEVFGQRIADGVADADRLAATTDERVRVRVDLPERAAGTGYSVDVEPSADAAHPHELVLRSGGAETTVSVAIGTRAPLADARVSGGSVLIAYDGSTGELTLTEY